jgi:hypothetical protein
VSGFQQTPDPAASATDMILVPVVPVGIQGTRGDQANYEGGVYRVERDTALARIGFRITTAGVGAMCRLGLYQVPGGRPDVAALIAGGTVDVSAAGGFYLETPGAFVWAGECYLLYGRSVAGGYTMRAYGMQSYDTMNQNVPAGMRPLSFTTGIPASGELPATFDPRAVADGGQAVASVANTMPVIRLVNP